MSLCKYSFRFDRTRLLVGSRPRWKLKLKSVAIFCALRESTTPDVCFVSISRRSVEVASLPYSRYTDRAEAICKMPKALATSYPNWLVPYGAPSANRIEGECVVYGDLLRHEQGRSASQICSGVDTPRCVNVMLRHGSAGEVPSFPGELARRCI